MSFDFNSLIPELTVSDIDKTREFYIDKLGFKLEYERIEEKFIFLSFEGSQFMFEQYHLAGWNVGELEYPYGRGINFSIHCSDAQALYNRLKSFDIKFYSDFSVAHYETNQGIVAQGQFLILDPDGYLLRFTD